MRHGGGPSHGDSVAFANNVIEHEVEIGESTAERCMKRFEVTGADEHRVGFGKPCDLPLEANISSMVALFLWFQTSSYQRLVSCLLASDTGNHLQ